MGGLNFWHQLIGQAFGSTYEVQKEHLVKVNHQEDNDAATKDTIKDEEETEADKDNRNLTDSRGNQKMTKEEIQALRKQGASGQDIVGQLIENSATFKEKT